MDRTYRKLYTNATTPSIWPCRRLFVPVLLSQLRGIFAHGTLLLQDEYRLGMGHFCHQQRHDCRHHDEDLVSLRTLLLLQTNTDNSFLILYRLVSRSSAQYAINQRRVKHSVVLEAICESALVTWIGVILLEIAELAPTKGHVNVRML